MFEIHIFLIHSSFFIRSGPSVEARCEKSKKQKFSNIKLKTHEAILNFEALLWVGSGVSSLKDLVLDVQR